MSGSEKHGAGFCDEVEDSSPVRYFSKCVNLVLCKSGRVLCGVLSLIWSAFLWMAQIQA
jgi:hypothetical protein